MRINVDDDLIRKMDKVIKIQVAASGLAEPKNLLARVVWNACFNKAEIMRAKKILDTISDGSKYKDYPECKGMLPKEKV